MLRNQNIKNHLSSQLDKTIKAQENLFSKDTKTLFSLDDKGFNLAKRESMIKHQSSFGVEDDLLTLRTGFLDNIKANVKTLSGQNILPLNLIQSNFEALELFNNNLVRMSNKYEFINISDSKNLDNLKY